MTQDAPSSRPSKHPGNEEPDIGFEESVPSDGNDPVGQAMIDELGNATPAPQPDKVPPAPAAGPMPRQFPVS